MNGFSMYVLQKIGCGSLKWLAAVFYLQNSIPGEEFFLVRRASMKRNENQ